MSLAACSAEQVWIGLDWICLATTHVLQDILAVLHKWGSLIAACDLQAKCGGVVKLKISLVAN